MSPEQVDGNPAKIGPATDIYSLGIVFYHMLTGQLPFKGSLTSILNQIGSKQPAKPSAINLDIVEGSPLEEICMRMVAKSPADRFPTMAEVAKALEEVCATKPDIPVTHSGAMGRLKTWSSGIFSRLVPAGSQRKPPGGSSSESAPDADTPTQIGPI
jgi:serine/threonine-protein kinase